jgi:peptide/histidine transporter 3/4
VYVAAFRNRNLPLPENPDDLYEISRSKASPDTEFVAHRDKPFRLIARSPSRHMNTVSPPINS